MENIIFYNSNRYNNIKLFEKFQGVKLISIIQDVKESNIDRFINEKIIKELEEKEFDNIFIPLSPLYSFSDYLGFYIALMIKVSNTKNKLANIFIYGTELQGDIFKNEYFQVTLFKEVNLIEYSKNSIEQYFNNKRICTEEEWYWQVNHINISAPSHYYDDNHSIANEWGIYQMARNADLNIEEITDLDKDKCNSLYFKWLISKNRLYKESQKVQKEDSQKPKTIGYLNPKKVLLIDDLALKGWKQVLEKVLTLGLIPIEIATNIKDAQERLKEKYDLIFLDMRLGEKDHYNYDIEEYGGFKLLKEIKSDFKNTNFSTPIILITASNKIWNIDRFKEYGVDFYYIKEHPNYVYSKNYSIKNFKRLKEDFILGKEYSERRYEVWNLCKAIIEKIEQHPYFKTQDKRYSNVKKRIIDKIKLGYYYLFKESTEMEKEKLLANNESIAFIIFWSILEEIVKGYTDIDETWNEEEEYKRKDNWKFRNNNFFIQDGKNITDPNNKEDYNIYVNLSTQVEGLISCYIEDSSKQNFYKEVKFRKINKYRNHIDYIHSSVLNIFTKELIEDKNVEECFKKNKEILTFIKDILEYD